MQGVSCSKPHTTTRYVVPQDGAREVLSIVNVSLSVGVQVFVAFIADPIMFLKLHKTNLAPPGFGPKC